MKIFLTVLFLWVGVLMAEPDLSVFRGESSFKFLKLFSDARSASLSGGGIASPKNAGESVLNPLAMTQTAGPHMSATRNILPKEFGASSGALVFTSAPQNSWNHDFSGLFLGYNDLASVDEDGNRLGTSYGAYSFSLGMGIGHATKNYLWGARLQYAQSTIEMANSHAIMLGFSSLFHLPFNFDVATSLLNVGEATAFEKQAVILPLTAQVGMARTVSVANFDATILMDLRQRNDEPLVWIPGTEIIWNEVVALRLSLPQGSSNPALSAGCSLKWSPLEVAYAYRGDGVLGGAHTIEIGIDF